MTVVAAADALAASAWAILSVAAVAAAAVFAIQSRRRKTQSCTGAGTTHRDSTSRSVQAVSRQGLRPWRRPRSEARCEPRSSPAPRANPAPPRPHRAEDPARSCGPFSTPRDGRGRRRCCCSHCLTRLFLAVFVPRRRCSLTPSPSSSASHPCPSFVAEIQLKFSNCRFRVKFRGVDAVCNSELATSPRKPGRCVGQGTVSSKWVIGQKARARREPITSTSVPGQCSQSDTHEHVSCRQYE